MLSIVGLLWTVNREQRKRFASTQELNQRNQEAILRLLDEMGSLAEGDLTVKATVTEDITGAIADSINFTVDELRRLVATINETAVQVAASAQETQATAMHLAEAAEHQAQQITSASAADQRNRVEHRPGLEELRRIGRRGAALRADRRQGRRRGAPDDPGHGQHP